MRIATALASGGKLSASLAPATRAAVWESQPLACDRSNCLSPIASLIRLNNHVRQNRTISYSWSETVTGLPIPFENISLRLADRQYFPPIEPAQKTLTTGFHESETVLSVAPLNVVSFEFGGDIWVNPQSKTQPREQCRVSVSIQQHSTLMQIHTRLQKKTQKDYRSVQKNNSKC